MIVQMSDLGDNGRFGNQIFQFFFLKMAEQALGCDIRCPYWDGIGLFDLQPTAAIEASPEAIDLEPMTSRSRGPQEQLDFLKNALQASERQLVDIKGYFQYHTVFFQQHRNLFLETFSVRPLFIDQVRQALARIGMQDRFVIGVHVRRGDYLQFDNKHPLFWGSSAASIRAAIEDLGASSLRNAIIYVCSDDLDYARDIFQGYGVPVITNRQLFSQSSEFSDLAVDFVMLTLAKALLISNSSLSFVASMLNTACRINLRPCPREDKFIPFDPWNSHVILPRHPHQFI